MSMDNKNELIDMIGVAMWGTKVIVIGQDYSNTIDYGTKEAALERYSHYVGIIASHRAKKSLDQIGNETKKAATSQPL